MKFKARILNVEEIPQDCGYSLEVWVDAKDMPAGLEDRIISKLYNNDEDEWGFKVELNETR